MNKQVIIYGAGNNAGKAFENVKQLGYSPVCFCDADKNKQGTTYLGLPITSLEDARIKFQGILIYVSLASEKKYDIMDWLVHNGISKDEIINYEAYSKYRGCRVLETCLVADQGYLFYCCYLGEMRSFSPPKSNWRNSLEETIENFLQLRDKLIKKLKNNEKSAFCGRCTEIKIQNFAIKKNLENIAFGFDSACNLACCYCVHGNLKNKIEKNAKKWTADFDWKVFFDILEHKKLIIDNTTITHASGEITCNPRKNEILDITEKYRLTILTNAILFDERIGHLITRPGSSSTISIDAGNRETYKQIKGVDVFDRVFINVGKYTAMGGNITLKYIFMPANSNKENVEGFIINAVNNGIRQIYLSANVYKETSHSDEQIEQMANMITLAKKNDLVVTIGVEINKNDIERINSYL
jgi:sulfatase maturation enzyme AslB (radical SAM superfamily)